MAQVPYNDGVPSVAPETRPPDDYQHIRAEPDQFGALIGQGLERGGKGLEQAGENVFDAIKFQNNTDANDQVNHFDTARNHIATGDPSKTTMGADGKPVPDMGYFGLEGRPALDKREDAIKALNDAREEGRKNLKNPAAQLEYDRQTRRMYTEYESKINSHAEAQYKVWAGGVNQKGALNSLNDFTNHLDNPEEMSHHARDYIDFKVKASQLKFGDDPTINRQVIDQSKRELLEAQTSAVAVKDPAAALRILEKNREIAGTQYDEMYGKLRNRALDQTAAQKTGEIIAKSRGGTFSRPVEGAFTNVAERYGLNPEMLRRSAQIESGGNPNAQTGSYKGLFQLSDGEFRKYGPRGGSIWSPQDNAEAAAAKMKAEGDQFATNFGRQPTGFDHYMIHQQGLAGYSSHLANPNAPAWQNMAATGEGREKGAAWAKKAIWGNIPDQYKASFGSVDNVTSRDFLNMWAAKFGGGSAPQFAGTGGVNVMSPLSSARPPQPQPVAPVAWHFPESESATGQGRAAYEQAAFPVPNVASMIKPNVIQQVLDDPEAQADPQLMTKMLHDANQTLAAQEIAENQNTKVKKEASDTAANGYVTTLADMMHSPKPDYVALTGKIAHDPNLTWETKEKLMDRVRRSSGEEQALAFGPGYMKAREALFSAPGDAGHIDDFTSLVHDPDITTAGLKDLSERMSLVKRSVDHGATERRISSFLTGAKKDLSFEEDNGFIKIRDPKGEQIYNYQFVPDFVKRASELTEQAQKTGDHKKLDEFLSRENVQKMVRQYRNPQEMAADKLAASGQANETPERPGTPLPPTPEGMDDAGWKAAMNIMPAATSSGPMSHERWGKMLTLLNSDPSPQMLAKFDEWAAPLGLKAIDVLGKINPAAAKAAQMTGHIGDTTNLEAADKEMHLTPQEKALYERHLDNLTGPGGVDNADGSRSSLFQAVQEHDGRFYNIPTVWNGKIETERWKRPSDGKEFDVPNKTALANVEREGWRKFPSYATAEEADARYEQMHKFMEKDTGAFLKSREGAPKKAPNTPHETIFERQRREMAELPTGHRGPTNMPTRPFAR